MNDLLLGRFQENGGIKVDFRREYSTLNDALIYGREHGYTHIYSYSLDRFIAIEAE